MSSQPTPFLDPRHVGQVLMGAVAVVSLVVTGCQDGPLYALKAANPFYSYGEWKRDEAIGVTDHERRMQLTLLAETIDQMPANKQQFWAGHLENLIDNDDSPEMRRLAVRAAGRLTTADSMGMINRGLDDDSMKVRMEACRALGRHQSEEATRLLVATIGTETSDDVKHAAIESLADHGNQIALDSLKTALRDRNPATRDLAVESLKTATGKDFGDDPQVWIAALDGKPTQEVPTRIADRVREISPF